MKFSTFILSFVVVLYMTTDITPPQTSDSCATVECFEGCGTEIPVAIWEDSVLSDWLKPICYDCHDDVPECNLWDVSEFEEHPILDNEHPIPEGEEYAVVDKHRNWEEEVAEMFDGEVPSEEELESQFNADDMSHVFEEPEELRLEIYIRDPHDEELLQEARDEARRRLTQAQ